MAGVTNEIIASLANVLRPKLGAEARNRIMDTIQAEREVGSSQVATDIEFLLRYHDNAHKALEQS